MKINRDHLPHRLWNLWLGKKKSSIRGYAFPAAVAIVITGALLHLPDYIASRHQNFMMAGMPMDPGMTAGMVMIAGGLLLGAWGLLPDRAARLRESREAARFSVPHDARLGWNHLSLVLVLTIGLVVDTMKPATLGFVVPPMAVEYHISITTSSLLPLVAISGTVLGSLAWGRLADIYGRRSTILISGLVYVSTSICGFMPSFKWNLLMCFLMGWAAGGMLPVVYSLTSESIPARHRGWIVVTMSGTGASLGYLVASGAATVIEPDFGWRALWLLGAPTGLLLLMLSRWIPESPRFLMVAGRHDDAREVMAWYGVPAASRPGPATDLTASRGAKTTASTVNGPAAALILMRGIYQQRTLVVVLYGVAWGIVNWGFITFLPTYLTRAGAGTKASSLLFIASLLALPATVLAGVLYARWGSKRSMLLYTGATGILLAISAVSSSAGAGNAKIFVGLTAALLASSNGMLAMLSPYATEIYPTTFRASGSGVAAAASKTGGIFGPALLTAAPDISTLALCALIPIAVAFGALWRFGPETSREELADLAISDQQHTKRPACP
jgi:putative MFS transporter